MKSIYVNGHTYHEGDEIYANLRTGLNGCDEDSPDFIAYDSEEQILAVKGIINIQSDNCFYICQNAKSGADSHTNKSKKYGWEVFINDAGMIGSSDTTSIWSKYATKAKPMVEVDDDPMPEDWELPFSIPEYL